MSYIHPRTLIQNRLNETTNYLLGVDEQGRPVEYGVTTEQKRELIIQRALLMDLLTEIDRRNG